MLPQSESNEWFEGHSAHRPGSSAFDLAVVTPLPDRVPTCTPWTTYPNLAPPSLGAALLLHWVRPILRVQFCPRTLPETPGPPCITSAVLWSTARCTNSGPFVSREMHNSRYVSPNSPHASCWPLCSPYAGFDRDMSPSRGRHGRTGSPALGSRKCYSGSLPQSGVGGGV